MQDKIYLDIQKNFEEYVEAIDDFDSSIFGEVYESLYKVLNTILSEGKKKRGDIITVLGKRGSGKSSLMWSFASSLKEKDNKRIHWRNVQFSVMENLDASMLDSSEDIFDILLSRMLKNIDERIESGRFDAPQNRQVQYDILQLIDEIYVTHQLIKKGKERGNIEQIQGYSSLSTLRNAPDSLEMTYKFEKLVEKYLEIMLGTWGEGEERRNYLVVSIDDLDMNSDKGFESLEQLYRYVAVKNVIVVVAVKYEQIMYLAEKSGYKIYPKIDRELDNSKVEYVKDFAKEYLAKLLPIQGRVHMPDIVVDQQKIQKKWYIKEEGRDAAEYTIKESILFKIREKTGMCFDICGKKLHFLIPESLRELKGYYGYLDGQPAKNLSGNIEQFASDFLNRITNRKLTQSNRKEILFLCGLDFVGVNNRLNYILKEKMKEVSGYAYQEGYGELLRYLYQTSRNIQEEREFVDAVLVFYTYLAQRERIKITKAEGQDGQKDVLKELFIGSWAGSWSNYFVPAVYIEDAESESLNEDPVIRLAVENSRERIWGCMEKIVVSSARIGIEWECERTESIDEWITANADKIKILEWIFFFFEEFYSSTNTSEDIRLDMEWKPEGRMEWTLANSRCDFNILAFIRHSYYFEEYFDKLHTAIAYALLEGFQDTKTSATGIKAKLKKKSKLYKMYVKWFKFSEGIAVPFQYPDIYYHVLHRTQKQSHNQTETLIRSGGVIDSLQLLFRRIENILREEDEGYKGIGGTGFADNFVRCPFVSVLLGENENEAIDKWDENDRSSLGGIVERCAMVCVSSRKRGRAKIKLSTSDDVSFREYDW